MKTKINQLVEREKLKIAEQLIDNPVTKPIQIITVGEDEASKVYVQNKKKLLSDLGITCVHTQLGSAISQSDLNNLISAVDCPTLLQLPLPHGLTAPAIPKDYDIDGFSPDSLGDIMSGNPRILPCTVQGIMDIIEEVGVDVRGTKVAILGRSKIVGIPLAVELINRQATVTSYNSLSDLTEVNWRLYDIIVTATGCHGVVKSSYFCSGQLVIDVGINRVDGKLCGDVLHDHDSEAQITPVPFGVGRLTVLNVVKNAIKLSV